MDCYDAKFLPQMFDSFCKTVLRNEARDYYRKTRRSIEHETLVRDFYGLDREVWDKYPSHMNVFRVFGHEVVIDSDILYEALNVLPEINREILLLHEYLRMSDDEISKKVSMCRSTVRNKRIDALKELRGKLCLSCSQEI